MANHATFSPSAAVRWLQCPGSLVLGRDKPRTSSEAADEGTAAHALAERCLTEVKNAADFYGFYLTVDIKGEVAMSPMSPAVEASDTRTFTVDEDMARHVQTYLDAVRALTIGGSLAHIEHYINLTPVMGIPDQGGTADYLILYPLTAGGYELQVHDLKFGQGKKVFAEDNPQLMLYAAGALREFEEFLDIRSARGFIHQPRLSHVSEQEYTLDALDEIGKRSRHAVATVTLVDEGKMQAADALAPSADACQWCSAKADCPKLAALAFEVLQEEPDVARAAENIALAAKLDKCEVIELWIDAVRGESHARLMRGEALPGWKVVKGKAGHRAWSDEEVAAKVCRSIKLPADDVYAPRTIKTPAALEALIKDGKLTKEKWAERLAVLITQPEGKPAMAKASDKRPALVMGSVAEDFAAAAVENMAEAFI